MRLLASNGVKYTLIAGALAVSLCIAAGAVLLSAPDSSDTSPIEVQVQDGDGLRQIAAYLDDKGIIRSRFAFTVYLVLSGRQSQLKAGRYLFSKALSAPKVADIIVLGLAESDDVQVTVPEGFNIWEVDARLASAGFIQAGELSAKFQFKEGHLFPDTYRFDKEATLEDIVNKMEQNYFAKGMTRSDIAIITASILEKEAKKKEDMVLVAGIIEKRMEIGMALQVDATVAYGWCLKEFTRTKRNCDVTQAPIVFEIKKDGPYNTYLRTGLPPAAISNPGITALSAAANPKKSDYLYYLSTRDGSQIIYSKTAAEHAANRKKYLGI